MTLIYTLGLLKACYIKNISSSSDDIFIVGNSLNMREIGILCATWFKGRTVIYSGDILQKLTNLDYIIGNSDLIFVLYLIGY